MMLFLSSEHHTDALQLTSASPYLTTLTCGAMYAPSFPRRMKHLLGVGTTRALAKLAKTLAKTSDFQKAMLGTTTAVDVINGGVKVNALPEVVTSLVNFRIDFDESIAFAQEHVEQILAKVAKKHGLEFVGFGSKGKQEGRFIKVELLGEALEPAPRTPSEGPVWELFAGTVKCVRNNYWADDQSSHTRFKWPRTYSRPLHFDVGHLSFVHVS